MNARIIWIVAIVGLLVVGGFVVLVAGFVYAMFGLMSSSDAHVCGMAAIQKSSAAADLLGTPIVQKGVTNGRSDNTNGELTEHMRWTVSGPRGEATVEANGNRSDLDSHLTVRIGREGGSQVVYDGKFDCPELHGKR